MVAKLTPCLHVPPVLHSCVTTANDTRRTPTNSELCLFNMSSSKPIEPSDLSLVTAITEWRNYIYIYIHINIVYTLVSSRLYVYMVAWLCLLSWIFPSLSLALSLSTYALYYWTFEHIIWIINDIGTILWYVRNVRLTWQYMTQTRYIIFSKC